MYYTAHFHLGASEWDEVMLVVSHKQVSLEYIVIKLGGFWSFLLAFSTFSLSYILYRLFMRSEV